MVPDSDPDRGPIFSVSTIFNDGFVLDAVFRIRSLEQHTPDEIGTLSGSCKSILDPFDSVRSSFSVAFFSSYHIDISCASANALARSGSIKWMFGGGDDDGRGNIATGACHIFMFVCAFFSLLHFTSLRSLPFATDTLCWFNDGPPIAPTISDAGKSKRPMQAVGIGGDRECVCERRIGDQRLKLVLGLWAVLQFLWYKHKTSVAAVRFGYATRIMGEKNFA